MNLQGLQGSTKTLLWSYRAWFGAEPVFVALAWLMILQSGWMVKSRATWPFHLLWNFLWIKVYSTEDVLTGMVAYNVKPFQMKVWFLSEGIACLYVTLVSNNYSLQS